jgi:hypothetical protein
MRRERRGLLSVFAIVVACRIAAQAGPTNSQPVQADFRIPARVDVSVIVVYAMEDSPDRSPKFPMRVTMPRELTRTTDTKSISDYAALANAVCVTGKISRDRPLMQ